jgi:hypothetical protein
VPGIDGRDLPSPSFEMLVSELRRVLASGVPAPLPRSFYADAEAA